MGADRLGIRYRLKMKDGVNGYLNYDVIGNRYFLGDSSDARGYINTWTEEGLNALIEEFKEEVTDDGVDYVSQV